MQILITGAAGFIGSHLCEHFIQEGHQVIGVDNLLTGSMTNIDLLTTNVDFQFIRQDVNELFSIDNRLDAVLHFASPASPNPRSPYGYPNLPIETLKAGSFGTFNTLELARVNKAHYVLASTSEVYGDPLVHPQQEEYWGHVNPVGLRSMYDEAKRFAEALVMAYYRSRDTDTRIIRIFNTYGPRMRLDDGRVIPNMITQALHGKPLTVYGDGQQTRSFCYVDDLVRGIHQLLLSEEHLPVNIGNPVETTVNEIAQLINELTDNQAGISMLPEYRLDDDPQRRCPDIAKARSVLKWEPRITLRNGLLKTIDYFKKTIHQA